MWEGLTFSSGAGEWVAKKNTFYTITVLNWEKHNPNRRKSYKYTMIANNFLYDAKIRALPASHQILFLGILLICGDYSKSSISVGEEQVNSLLRGAEETKKGWRRCTVGPQKALARLQSLQLLTYTEQNLSLINLNKEKRKECNNNEEEQKPLPAFQAGCDLNFLKIWNENCGTLPKANSLTDKRLRASKKLLQLGQSEEYWISIVKKIAASKFHTGGSKAGWKANIDWFLKPDSHIKIEEEFTAPTKQKDHVWKFDIE